MLSRKKFKLKSSEMARNASTTVDSNGVFNELNCIFFSFEVTSVNALVWF